MMDTTTLAVVNSANSSSAMNGSSAVNDVATTNDSSKTKINKIFKMTNESSSSSIEDDARHLQQQQQQRYQAAPHHLYQMPGQHYQHPPQYQQQQQNQQHPSQYQHQQGYVNNNYMHHNLNSNSTSTLRSEPNAYAQYITPEEDDNRYDDEYDPNLNDYEPGVSILIHT
jgi:hypothetical protein